MNNKKSATVLLAVYIGDTLVEVKKCLDSVLDQSFKDFNVLIILDGNLKEDVYSFIRSQEKAIDYIQCVKRGKNMGLAHALNYGIENLNSEFIIRVDADSISMPDRFKIQIEHLISNKKIDVLGSIIEEIRDKGENYFQKMPLSHEECLKEFKFRNPINHPTAVFRTTFFSKAGLYPTKYYKDEDSALWLNGFLNKCIYENIDEPLVKCKLDNELLDRRKNIKGVFATFINKIRISYHLNFGFIGYLFAFLRLVIMLSPKSILMKSYLMRNKIWKILKN